MILFSSPGSVFCFIVLQFKKGEIHFYSFVFFFQLAILSCYFINIIGEQLNYVKGIKL